MKLIKLMLLLVVFFIPGTLAQNNETLTGVEVYAGERVLTEGNLTEVNWSSYETLNFPIILTDEVNQSSYATFSPILMDSSPPRGYHFITQPHTDQPSGCGSWGIPSDYPTLYDNYCYCGNKKVISSDTPDLGVGVAASVFVPEKYAITIFEYKNYQGKARTFYQSMLTFPEEFYGGSARISTVEDMVVRIIGKPDLTTKVKDPNKPIPSEHIPVMILINTTGTKVMHA